LSVCAGFARRPGEGRPVLPCVPGGKGLASMSEIIFEVGEDEVDGGYTAHALGYGIHTQGETVEELRVMVKDAVRCYFDETMQAPKIIRLHFVRDEVLA
jgi:predicted RNase H-like HicB family nuclease